MIEASEFIEAARKHGFQRYTGVPCSFLTPFINYVIDDDTLDYVSSANEGDALATAAGAVIGGQRAVVMMQNSGLGNAVSPLTSLAYVFKIPMLIITTHRGQPGLKDEPQHELMGQITDKLLDTMRVPWEVFPKSGAEIEACLKRALGYMETNQRPYAFIMHKGTVARHEPDTASIPARGDGRYEEKTRYRDQSPAARQEVLQRIIGMTPEDDYVIIATTGYTGRELFALSDRANHLYMVGSMGCASSLALGLALARPDLKVVVIDGDGAALMRMGNFSTLGSYAGNNLIHVLLDNEVHDSTGAQATVAANVRFAGVAAACGYSLCYEGNDPDMLDELFNSATTGPKMAHLKIRPGTIDDLPRPDVTPEQVLKRLMDHIGTTF
ncbi:MAG: phosphonopyruvate decarboxylase [Thiotrichales bacterium]|nr:phosphonopyruvate decarboxylase [Thiotrichales bacterium]